MHRNPALHPALRDETDLTSRGSGLLQGIENRDFDPNGAPFHILRLDQKTE